MKVVFWLLPLGRRTLYNENNDFYSARDLRMLLRHAWWRLSGGWQRLKTALLALPNRATVLGSASPAHLAAIVDDLRRRHPGADCHGFLLPALSPAAHPFDSATTLWPASAATYLAILGRAFGRHRSGYLVLPCTAEGYGLLKVVFWLLPLGRRELYNENDDFYPARDLRMLLRHAWWRLRAWLTRRPNRVTVLGTASGLYLKGIVVDLRQRYAGARIHALLPGSLVVPTAYLFDSYTLLDATSVGFWRDLFSLTVGRQRSGHLMIPCTNEGHTALKLVGFCLPLGLREIYNENIDSYLLRDVRTLVRHAFWRLRHRIFYQALTERRGRFLPLHLLHLFLYPARLLAGAALLGAVRLRAWRMRMQVRPALQQPAIADEMVAQAEHRLESAEAIVSREQQ